MGVPDAQAETEWKKLRHCNNEAFAYRIDTDPNDGVENIFFGTTLQTNGQTINTPDGQVTCHF